MQRLAAITLLGIVMISSNGCGTTYQPPVWPEGSLRFVQGTNPSLGACSVGVAAVSNVDDAQPWWAQLAIAHPQAGHSGRTSVSVRVHGGELLPVCGGLYRVVGLEPDHSDADGRPGDARGAVVFAPMPVAVAGVQLAADSLVVPVGARVGFVDPSGTPPVAQLTAELKSVSAAPQAQFETWPGSSREAASPAEVRTVEVKAGDHLQVQNRRYRVLAVQPADAARKLGGWVELTGLPVP
jgi:hypothetical protein